MPQMRVTPFILRILFALGFLAGLLPAALTVQAANGFDVTILTLPPGLEIQPNFDPRSTLVDHVGAIYFRSQRTDGSERGIYRLVGGNVEPFLLTGAQIPAQTLDGIGTLVNIDNLTPVRVDTAGRLYFFNQTFTVPGGQLQLLRLETGGGFTLLDTGGPIQGLVDRSYPFEVLSDGRWLRRSEELINGAWVVTIARTDGTSTQQLLRRAMTISSCVDALKTTNQWWSLKTNAQGKSVFQYDVTATTHRNADCTGTRTSSIYTQTLGIVGAGVHAELGTGANDTVLVTMDSYSLNDSGQILYATKRRDDNADTYALLRDNQTIHTLTIEDEEGEEVERTFDFATLLPDGNLLYAIPPGIVAAHPAGGLFRDGQLVIAGNDPLFATPVSFGRIGQVNSRGEVIVDWRTTTGDQFGWVLLSKAQGRWTNSNGGVWSDPFNWAGEEMPGQGDSVLFNLANQYTVSTGDRQVGSVEVTDGEVTWNQGLLEIIGGLRVGAMIDQGDTTLRIDDRVTVGEVTVGALPNSATASDTVAGLTLGPDATLNVSGPLVIGQAGRGGFGLFGGKLSSGEARLGNGAIGILSTLGEGEWSSGSLLVGESYPGYVNFGSGSTLQSSNVRIGGSAFSPNFDLAFDPSGVEGPFSKVSILGTGGEDGNNPTSWSIQQALEIGNGHPGRLHIADGGTVQVAESVTVDNVATNLPVNIIGWSQILVSGVDADSQRPATWLINQDLLLGNVNTAAPELSIEDGGIVDIGGSLSIGHQPETLARLTVTGAGSTLTAGQSAGAACTIGFSGLGELIVRDGGDVHCQSPLFIGLGDDESLLTISGATSRVRTLRLEVGAPAATEPTGIGTVELSGGGLFFEQQSTIWENGRLKGSGTLEGDLVVLGEVIPDLVNLQATAQSSAAAAAAAVAQPGVLTVNGGLTLGSSGRLHLDLVGPGQYDQVVISGTVQLDGTLILAFGEGYAPKAGDLFQFVQADSAAGAFDSVTVTGLAAGWQYTINTSGGVTTLTSTNAGVATTSPTPRTVYLPAIRR